MNWRKESLGKRVAVVALMALAAGWGTVGGAEIQFTADLNDGGDLVRGSGAGYDHGSWYYYSGSDWWTQWFLSGAVDTTQKMVVDVDLTVTTLSPVSATAGSFEVAVNWTKQTWTDQAAPPMPDIKNPSQESKYIESRQIVERTDARQTVVISTSMEISDFCPAWVSIDFRGENVSIEGQIRYTCVSRDSSLVPTTDCEFGDAPEGVIAYPDEGVVGMFPTCVGVGPAAWIEHSSTGKMYFGAKVDVEREGNGGKCPIFAPDQYNGDEKFNDGDAGLLLPRAYTITGEPGSQTVVPLTFTSLEAMGDACDPITWNSTIDIQVCNKSGKPAYVNVLFDWNHDGIWEGSSWCDDIEAPEHVLINFPVPNGYVGPLSTLLPPSFQAGPLGGYVWARFTISGQQVPEEWNGDGIFLDGETEDYLLYLREATKSCRWEEDDPCAMHWAQTPDMQSTGIGVDLSQTSLADDFQAAQSGPLTEIHFWGSFKDDTLPSVPAITANELTLDFNIYSDKQVSGVHQPNKLLWTKHIDPYCDFSEVSNYVRAGWFDPSDKVYERSNHKRTFQYDFCFDKNDDRFTMTAGTTYWLEIKFTPSTTSRYQFGWKTTTRNLQYGNCAMWKHPQYGWTAMTYPDGHDSYSKAMDLAFVVVGDVQTQKNIDFGDAPDPTYSTLLSDNGARHMISPGVYLGSYVDGEADGQPNATATGDDIAGTDDEDGVVFTTDLIPGEPATVQVTASTAGALNAWIDWNADGDWDDAGEQIAVDTALSWGVNTLTIDVPALAASGKTFARFRFSTVRGLRYNGLASDGEVEDYQIEISEPFETLPPTEHVTWSQPPIEGESSSLVPVFCGWDEPAYATRPLTYSTATWKLAADDFRCLGDMPVTSVHWWGSYQNWKGSGTPSVKPESWRIVFWSNAKADSRYSFNRPDKLLWVVSVTPDRVQEEVAGMDEFPQESSDRVFRYQLALKAAEYFYQDQYLTSTQDDVFWISIVAVYTGSPGPENPWGWTTRPQPWGAAAVAAEFRRDEIRSGFSLDPTTAQPLTNSLLCERLDTYDLAFELDTDPAWIKCEQAFTGLRDWPYYEDEQSLAVESAGTVAKWSQQPDTATTSIDVDFTKDLPTTWPATICADDFECTQTGPITSITIWASWYQDVLSGSSAENATFTLSIRQDIPADRSSTGYSMPGTVLWRKTFNRGEFTVEPVQTYVENYYCPSNSAFQASNRAKLYKYTFTINSKEAFQQTGTVKSPVVYWLAAQSVLVHSPGSTATRLGWKSSTSHWNDSAVWVKAEESYDGVTWNKLTYPQGHSQKGKAIDLAFAIETEQAGTDTTARRIVADDWRCATTKPVTAVTWWGSYIGYSYQPDKCQQATSPQPPDSFLLTLWSDVPDSDLSSTKDFGHPGRKLWEYNATAYDEVMVGFDNSPYPTLVATFPPVYRYTVRLPEDKWFCPDGQNSVLWLSVVAVYKDEKSIVYPWGWTNHPYAAWDLDLVPLAHWKLDESKGTVAADSSGNGNNGTVVGNPVWRSTGGWLDGALEFDGRGDYIKVEKPKGFNFAPGSFSVSTWIYPKETRGRWHAIMEYDRSSLYGNRFGLWLDLEGRFHFRVGQNTWQSPDGLTPNQWYHLTATYDSATKKMKIYVDGVLEATATNKAGFTSAKQATLIIGACGSADDEYFTGLIDDIRVFKIALTDDEVLLLSGAGRNEGAVVADMTDSTTENWTQLLDLTGMVEDTSFMLFTDPSATLTAAAETDSDSGSSEVVTTGEKK